MTPGLTTSAWKSLLGSLTGYASALQFCIVHLNNFLHEIHALRALLGVRAPEFENS